jgi:hypothetical protein
MTWAWWMLALACGALLTASALEGCGESGLDVPLHDWTFDPAPATPLFPE